MNGDRSLTLERDDIDACVFDAYGTLLDVASAVRHKAELIGPAWTDLAATWRTKQLEYTWLRSLMRDYDDFRALTEHALDYALDATNTDRNLRAELLTLYDRLDCYPEVPTVLTALRTAGIRTGILSNGTREMLDTALASAGITTLFDAIHTVEPLKIYKPDPRVYQLSVDGFSAPPERILFFSSNAWDVAGAAHFGFRVIWVNRQDLPRERLPAGPEHVVADLADVPTLLGV